MGKRIVRSLCSITVAVALMAGLVGCAGRTTPNGRIAVDPQEFDFGAVSNSAPVHRVVQVHNVGGGWLEITGLSTSCGCTTAELSSSVVPSGHRADLRVTFDADYHEIRGDVVRVVWFATNDPAHPWVEVRITADVGR